jgi:lipoprotein-releasing system ATP-binding protein
MSEVQGFQTVIEAKGISKVYWDGNRKLNVFENIYLSVKAGEGVAILGPSGSGKTTLLNQLSGMDKPSAGEVTIDGVKINALGSAERAVFRNKRIGFIFQFYHLLSEFTALENVFLPALVGGRSQRQEEAKAEGLLKQLGLGGRLGHYPAELSGGEQQRVAIARALMNDPKILFCDEPTGNLDPRMRAEIASLIRDFYAKDKKTVLIVTHDERLAKMADRVIHMDELVGRPE